MPAGCATTRRDERARERPQPSVRSGLDDGGTSGPSLAAAASRLRRTSPRISSIVTALVQRTSPPYETIPAAMAGHIPNQRRTVHATIAMLMVDATTPRTGRHRSDRIQAAFSQAVDKSPMVV